ncbi:hypothetical protein BDZ94DRAFT_1320696 [Collybia nuda]|uniref:Uncharacterized protein n=1 Tax=Collybia nuda TaxID=64659 RepID=A0A9P5YBI0_9AGAR|nr:hypothetical protein BDZ94DRAFT_1320696 [Collybia nuda]
MSSIADDTGPSYISSHSADVILSDIRPIKLKIEALRSINVLLDEFLYSILSTACSLSTDKLRASLLSLLPTTLGKEALLEAEVELRAYWDRTGPVDVTVPALEDDTKTFHLQWSFELLRLKCEAYSTLNEGDEDAGAEGRIYERLGAAGGTPPKAALMAPAALYLTAILEAMCEHILSNVGRVASRDSSRTSATVQDLFVALCEDHSIYDLFKTMKVYTQIEQLSKAPKPRRSKSFTRGDRQSRTASPHQDLSNGKDSASARSRLSSDTSGVTAMGGPPISTQSARSSFEKTRAMKMFMANSRASNDRDAEGYTGHRKTDSVLSENTKQTLAAFNHSESPTFEDEAMQQEFDDLMRSSSTMKVSLTPDRLKTMEVYKQEKDQRGSRRPAPLSFKSDLDPSSLPPRATGRRPSLLRVDSIKEDDEESPTKPPTTRNRQASVSNPPPSTVPPTSRIRAVSTSSAAPFAKLSRTSTPPPTMPVASGLNSMQNRHRMNKAQDPFPPRTRKIQQNRESIDLDDIMGDTDDDDEYAPKTPAKQIKQVTTTPNRHTVSAGTRDLMDFLAEGPPDLGGSRDMADFFAEGPSGYNASGTESTKPKSSGRLQRMISKLSLGNADKSKAISDEFRGAKVPQTPIRPIVNSQPSVTNLSSLANRPIPPRPPRPISPPSSPSRDSSDDQNQSSPRSRGQSLVRSEKRRSTDGRQSESSPVSPHKEYNGGASSNRRPPLPTNTNGHSSIRKVIVDESPKVSPARIVHAPTTPTPDIPTAHDVLDPLAQHTRVQKAPVASRKPAPVYLATPTKPHLSGSDAQDMHRLLSRATSADECRLIFDMFLAKSGISIGPVDYDIPYPSPSPSVAPRSQITPEDIPLEHSLVELMLGGDSSPLREQSTHKRRAKKKSKPETITGEPLSHSSHGDKKVLNGGHRVGNGEPHSNYRSLPGFPDGKETIIGPSGHAQNHTPISEVAT